MYVFKNVYHKKVSWCIFHLLITIQLLLFYSTSCIVKLLLPKFLFRVVFSAHFFYHYKRVIFISGNTPYVEIYFVKNELKIWI